MTSKEKELKRIKYPHMVKQEIAIWKRFIKAYGDQFMSYKYDIHVGKGLDHLPGYTRKEQEMAIRLTQKRIDVVAVSEHKVYIIEIKERAGMSAIGQLITYKILFEKRYGEGIIKGLIIVAEGMEPDMLEVYKLMNIKLIIV